MTARSLVVALASLAACRSGDPNASPDRARSAAIDSVNALQSQLIAAYGARDTAAIGRVLADEYVFTDARGTVYAKADLIRMFGGSNERVMISYQKDDERLRMYDGSAVLTYHYISRETLRGREAGGEYRMTRVFGRRNGRWQITAAHESPVAREAAPVH
jgi:ketosteroid isomerase-like protein